MNIKLSEEIQYMVSKFTRFLLYVLFAINVYLFMFFIKEGFVETSIWTIAGAVSVALILWFKCENN